MRHPSFSRELLWKFGLLLSLWLVVFFPLYPGLFETWLKNSNNSHGILVPFISLYFIWQLRDKIVHLEAESYIGGAVVLAISLFLYLVSYTGSVTFVARLMMVFSLYGLILFTLGKKFFNTLRFPLFFLIFLVPVPESIVNEIALPLQLFATTVSAYLLKALAISVYQEGNLLYFTQTQLEVAQACSGIRSIVSLGMISVIFAYMSEELLWSKIILIFSAIPIALVANIFRVTATGLLANFFGEQVAQGFLHEFSGFLVFFFGLMLLYGEFIILKYFFPGKNQTVNQAGN